MPIATGLLFTLAGVIAVGSSLQMLFERTFDQEDRGWRDLPRCIAYLAILLAVLIAEGTLTGPERHAAGPVVQAVLTFVVVAIFLAWTMHFLLDGRVSWRRVIRPALVTAVLWLGLAFFSAANFFFSAANFSTVVIDDSRTYGTIGVVFTLLTWFILLGSVIVLGAGCGGVWEQRSETGGHGERRLSHPRTGRLLPAGAVTRRNASTLGAPVRSQAPSPRTKRPRSRPCAPTHGAPPQVRPWERQERGNQQQQVELHDRRVDHPHPAEQPVMRDPHATNRQEARHIRKVSRPLVLQVAAKMTQIRRDLDLQHKDRDRDREHTIAERVQAPPVPPLGRCLLTAHTCRPRPAGLRSARHPVQAVRIPTAGSFPVGKRHRSSTIHRNARGDCS